MTSYADGHTYVEEVLLRGTPEEGINIKASHLVQATYFNGRPRIDDPVQINVADLDGFLPEWFAGMVGQVAAAEAARDVALADAKSAQDDRDAKVAAAEADRDAKVTAAEKDRDEKVAAAEAASASAIAAAETDRDARLAEKDAKIAELEAQIAALTAGTPVVKTYMSDLWRRATDAEGEIIEAMIASLPAKQRGHLNSVSYLDHADEQFPAVLAALAGAFGGERAAVLLAPSGG